LFRKPRVTWKDLSTAEWVLPPGELVTRRLLNSAFIRAGFNPPRPLYESSSFATSISFAAQLGVLALVPIDAARTAQSHGVVGILKTKAAAISAPISIVRRDTELQGKALSTFLDAIRKAAAARLGAGRMRRPVAKS
jgi:DNA-binding transcriptional LysR family regulator